MGLRLITQVVSSYSSPSSSSLRRYRECEHCVRNLAGPDPNSLDPPEMETRQLLLVSSIGLAINLWGMYATGGHHHHGHGHGHDHGHGHSHAHSHHVHEKKVGLDL